MSSKIYLAVCAERLWRKLISNSIEGEDRDRKNKMRKLGQVKKLCISSSLTKQKELAKGQGSSLQLYIHIRQVHLVSFSYSEDFTFSILAVWPEIDLHLWSNKVVFPNTGVKDFYQFIQLNLSCFLCVFLFFFLWATLFQLPIDIVSIPQVISLK